MKFLKVPHSIFDYELSPTQLKVYCILSRHKNHLQYTIMKHETICKIGGISSVKTVAEAIKILEEKGLIEQYRRKNKDGNYICNGYIITMLSGKWFKLELTNGLFQRDKSDFSVILLFAMLRNKKGRCFPSIRGIAKVLHITAQTVQTAINSLISLGILWKGSFWPGKHNLYIFPFWAKEKNATFGQVRSTRTNINTDLYILADYDTNIPNVASIVKRILEIPISFLLGCAKKVGISI